MVFLNINAARTPVPAAFPQSQHALFCNYPGRCNQLSSYEAAQFAGSKMSRFYTNSINSNHLVTSCKY